MKIFHFIYDHPENPWVGGGGAVRAYEIYKRLAAKHDITIISGKYPGTAGYRTKGNLKYLFLGSALNNYLMSTFCYAAEAAVFLRKHFKEADIIVEDFAPWNPIFSFLIRGRPVALQLHHKETGILKRFFALGIPFWAVQNFYPRFFDLITAVSRQTADKFHLNKENCRIISNGIDEGLLELAPSGGDYISFVGRLHIENKGLDTLLEAAKKIPGLKVAIAGRGPDEKKIVRIMEKYGIGGRVTLKGYLDSAGKGHFIAGSRFFVLPSRFEGQGIVALEAAACGKPAIVSDIPELSYAVDAGFGLPFKKGDAADLAAKISELIQNEGLAVRMGERGRAFARRFTWEKIALEYERFLLEAVRQG